MQEAAVLMHVADYFTRMGYRVWYNPSGLGNLELPVHQVAVGGHYPDLLGVDASSRVVAVETKGSDGDLVKGLGQALIYRQGANLAYLAAPADRLDGYVQPALASGIGVLKVGQAGVEEVQKPPSSVAMRFLPDVQRELALLAARGDQTRRIGSPRLTLNHPLHYLAPVLFIDEAASVEEVLDALGRSDGWALGASVVRVAVEGAKVLGLVAEDGGMLRLTEKGRLVRRMVAAATPGMTPPELRGLVSRQPLIDVNPLLGGILRFLYLEDPDVAELREHLRGHSAGLTLRELLAELLPERPNTALNIFCAEKAKALLLQHLASGNVESALSSEELSKWLMTRSAFQLKRQLIHVGILESYPSTGGGGAGSLDPDRDIWKLRI